MKEATIRYKKSETDISERNVLITSEVKPVKPAIVALDLSDNTPEEVEVLKTAYSDYQEMLKGVPSFEKFLSEKYGDVQVKWRRFLTEKVEYVEEPSNSVNAA